MMEDVFEVPKIGCCKVNIPLLKPYWSDRCCVLKFGNVGTENKPTEWGVQVIDYDKNGNKRFSTYIISEDDAFSIINDFNLKAILPPWYDGNPKCARKYVNKNSSNSWER
jgi:hypothetical protein